MPASNRRRGQSPVVRGGDRSAASGSISTQLDQFVRVDFFVLGFAQMGDFVGEPGRSKGNAEPSR
jgi:hypothetical protein